MKHSFAAVTGRIVAIVAIFSMSAPTLAQEETGALEEITVTAQFREQSAQDTPLAITAISGDTLEERSQSPRLLRRHRTSL